MTELLHFDQNLFLILNGTLHNNYLDFLMPILREKIIWAPLYVFIAGFLILNFKREGLLILLFLIATVSACDTLSSKVIKPWIKRDRPCNDPEIGPQTRLLVHCGGGKSFTSSHATNHFGIASFLGLIFVRRFPKLPYVLFGWAAAIAYAQVYVGVHLSLIHI